MRKLKFGSRAYRLKYLGQGKKSKTKRGNNMVKRRSRSSKSRGHSSGNPLMNRLMKVGLTVAVAGGYGAFRKDIADKLPNIKGVENYSDEMILGGVPAVISAITGNKWVNAVTKPILAVESARVGEKLKLGLPLSNSSITGSVSQSQDLAGYL